MTPKGVAQKVHVAPETTQDGYHRSEYNDDGPALSNTAHWIQLALGRKASITITGHELKETFRTVQ